MTTGQSSAIIIELTQRSVVAHIHSECELSFLLQLYREYNMKYTFSNEVSKKQQSQFKKALNATDYDNLIHQLLQQQLVMRTKSEQSYPWYEVHYSNDLLAFISLLTEQQFDALLTTFETTYVDVDSLDEDKYYVLYDCLRHIADKVFYTVA